MNQLHFEGVLEKHGKRFFEGFRKRWFILDGSELTYYKAPEYTDENYLGTIDMSLVRSVNPIKTVNNGFQIVSRTRTYTFSATSSELMTDWVSMLRQAMQLQSFENRRTRNGSQSKDTCVGAARNTTVPLKRNDSEQDDDDSNGMYESIANTKTHAASKTAKKATLKKSASSDSSIPKPKKGDLKKSSSFDSNTDSPEKIDDGPVGFYDFAKQPSNTLATYDFVDPPASPDSSNIQEQKTTEIADYETIASPSRDSKTKGHSKGGPSRDVDTYQQVHVPTSQNQPVPDYEVVAAPLKPLEEMEMENDLYDTVSDVGVHVTPNSAGKTPSGVGSQSEKAQGKPKQELQHEMPEFAEDVLYSKPNRKKVPAPLSIISEGSVDETELTSPADDGSSSPDECAPLPPPRAALYAIEELKNFFRECDDGKEEVKRQRMHSSNSEVFETSPGSAFEQLKNLLATMEVGQA